MDIPDQRYINHVRDALWSRTSRASVMIGSGFSRNALPNRPDVRELPLWRDLAFEMSRYLGPSPDVSSSCGPLALAQTYAEEFGRGSLDQFLQQQVRDHDFSPGEFHSRLLKLPWRDVFTTNWDTLVERTLPSVPERPYSVVHNKAEIPISSQPRVVKLHGSLDGHFPLIVTEDDYRKYPERHSPFVNTVQQAMMETAFVLIGFSGDDPNFLEWSSWVQKNLGESAPRVFLAGWLNLSFDDREELRCRNVVAIDIAQHPKASQWPEHLRDKYATDWILSSLEGGRPYDIANWPVPTMRNLPDSRERLQPVEVVNSDLPKKELMHPQDADASRCGQDLAQEVLRVWTHNRTVYPGWLMVPLEVRSSFVSRTGNWEAAILEALRELSPVERLYGIRELLWRYEVSLEPPSLNLESEAAAVLDLIDCEARTVHGDGSLRLDWMLIREAYREVALSLITAARHRLDEGAFVQRVADAFQFSDDDPNVNHRIRHERSLWAAWSLDFEKLDRLLSDWNTEHSDPIWMLRKAALLNEISRDDEAKGLIGGAILDIRRFPTDDGSVAGQSREGWGLYSVLDFENRQEVNNRWSELASRRCDASAETAAVANALTATRKSDDPPGFDLGVSRVSRILFGTGLQIAPSYRAVRLSEITGLCPASPTAAPFTANASHMMRLAAEKLAFSDPELAIRLVLRSCTYDRDKTLQRVLSRNHVAQLQADVVQRLTEDCIRLIDYSLPIRWVDRIRVGLEVLSRLVLRLEPSEALETLDYALGLYRNRQFEVTTNVLISPPLRNLLTRAWESLPQSQRAMRSLDLLGTPIVGLDGFIAQYPSRSPDPAELVHEDSAVQLPNRSDDNEAQWKDCINLLLRALRFGEEPRRRAAARLIPIAMNGFLSEIEESEIAKALWEPDGTVANILPSGTALHDWAFLMLPEPSPGLAEQRFHSKWLSPKEHSSRLDVIGSDGIITVSSQNQLDDPMKLEDTIWNVGIAIDGLESHGCSLVLSDEQLGYLVDVVSRWAEAPVSSYIDDPLGALQRYRSRVLHGLVPILTMIEIPVSVAETLLTKLRSLTDSGIPAYEPVGVLAPILPRRSAELAYWLRTGLASGNRDISTGAVYGLANWISRSSNVDSSEGGVPKDILRELGIIVAARRKESLAAALQVAKQVFDDQGEEFQAIIVESVLNGLDYLAEELRYDEGDDKDVVDLRWMCAHLAKSMSEAGLKDREAVARWLEIASNDPFPEIRHTTADDLGSPLYETEHEHTPEHESVLAGMS